MPVTRKFTVDTLSTLGGHLTADMRPYLDLMLTALAMRIHERLARLTPVDTGYLRASLSAQVGDGGGYAPPPKTSSAEHAYATLWGEADAATMTAIHAFTMGTVIAFGYTANYAPFVEDKVHMVQNVRSAVPSMVAAIAAEVRRGVARAGASHG